MAAIDDLIAQIEDEALRDRLREEADRLTKEKKFGLVFEEHLPELTPIYSAPIREGSRVARRDALLTDVWRVLSVDKGQALCLNPASGEQRQMPTDDLVVVCRFGEPIFPALTPVDRVRNGPDDAPWHTLIEADNYHALQLLEYLYTGQVDCIYIDPPYNTGARDWKYNNDYVDANDRWRHSKWLAMMNRRLLLSKHLLKDDGVLICTIDKWELYHLGILIDEVFPESEQTTVVIVHNDRGTKSNNFAYTHEYAIFVTPANSSVINKRKIDFDEQDEWKLRMWGANSLRKDRKGMFHPIYVEEGQVISIGDVPNTDFHPKEPFYCEGNQLVFWPIDSNGIERRWRWKKSRILQEANRLSIKEINGNLEIFIRGEEKFYKTIWHESKYDANTHGSRLVKTILGGTNFPYPKSLYAVRDCIHAVCGNRKDALIVDFFAGSGTTLHAVNLLNAEDGGHRRCILVTNNEVSEKEAKSLTLQGYHPGDPEWERHGICRAVTWPRGKYTILGRRDDGTELEGDYLTGNTVSKEKARTFRRLGYIDPEMLDTGARKQEIVSLIEGIPKTHIKADTAFFVSEDKRHTAAILFDDTQGDAFLDALEEMDHITHFYIVTRSNKLFQDLKAQITDLLGPIEVQEEEKHPMREGFPANLEYFKLDFLEKDQVALGRQFRAILPLLWLRAGAVGPRPKLTEDDSIPAMLLPAKNPFAVLEDETRFADFQAEVAVRDDLTHVFLITDSEEAFQEMAAQLTAPHVIQLYRDYLENFAINRGEIS